MSSSVGTGWRLRGIHSALRRPDRRVDRHVRCTHPERRRSRFALSLAPSQQVSNQRLPVLELAVGPRNWDVPFPSQFLDLFGSESLGLKFFLLLSEFPQSHSELSHRLAFGPVPGPQQLFHRRLDLLVLSHGRQRSWSVAWSRLQLFAARLNSFSLTKIWTARDHDRNILLMTHSVCQSIDWPTSPPSNGQQFAGTRSPINSVCQMVRQP